MNSSQDISIFLASPGVCIYNHKGCGRKYCGGRESALSKENKRRTKKLMEKKGQACAPKP